MKKGVVKELNQERLAARLEGEEEMLKNDICGRCHLARGCDGPCEAIEELIRLRASLSYLLEYGLVANSWRRSRKRK